MVSGAFEQNDLSFAATDLKTNIKSTLFTVDMMFKYRGFSATGAYTWGEREPQEINAKFDTSGWFAQAGYFLEAREVGDRRPLRRAGPERPRRARTRSRRCAAALNYFYARHALKVQLDFGQIKTETSSGDRKNNELRIQTQFIF